MIHSLSISKYQKIGIKRNFELFGGSTAFKRISSYVITCLVGDITTPSGDMVNLTDLYALQDTADYASLTVGGITISRAKLKGFDLKSGVFNKHAVA